MPPEIESITAYIGLGSNLGDRAGNITSAVDRLARTPGVHVTARSSLIETAAVGGPADSPPYLNAAIEVLTTLSPSDLLRRLQAIEFELGRVRLERWGPRTIDLDLLLYGDRSIATAELTVPHPLMHERLFVLEPLVQIAPRAVHGAHRITTSELLRKLRSP